MELAIRIEREIYLNKNKSIRDKKISKSKKIERVKNYKTKKR